MTKQASLSSQEQALQLHANKMQRTRLLDLFRDDKKRVEQFSLQSHGLYLDYSKNFATCETIDLLLDWAQTRQLPQHIQRLFAGDVVNSSQGQAALHWALRWPAQAAADIQRQVTTAWEQSCELAHKIRQGQWLSYSGQPFTDVLHIGIGGSELGPVLLHEALPAYRDHAISCHFLASNDPAARAQLLASLPASSTLVILVSKSFNGCELHDNRQQVQAWMQQQTGHAAAWQQQTMAVTANCQRAQALGIPAARILPLWSWLGGRFSISSAVSFSSMLQCGPQVFKQFLAGAAAMDQHFLQQPLCKNMPVILALLAVWYNHFFAASSQVVLTYSQLLRKFPDYLQQLSMESLGKTVGLQQESIHHPTGMIAWGGVAPQSQHSFHQLLMQGSHLVPADFIVPLTCGTSTAQQNASLWANAIAQAHTLMCGYQPEADDSLASSKSIVGNRPSNFLLLPSINPYHLGQLIALYEHKTYVSSVMLNINAFDQWGVEHGKQVAHNLLSEQSAAYLQSLDASSQALWHKCQHSAAQELELEVLD